MDEYRFIVDTEASKVIKSKAIELERWKVEPRRRNGDSSGIYGDSIMVAKARGTDLFFFKQDLWEQDQLGGRMA